MKSDHNMDNSNVWMVLNYTDAIQKNCQINGQFAENINSEVSNS